MVSVTGAYRQAKKARMSGLNPPRRDEVAACCAPVCFECYDGTGLAIVQASGLNAVEISAAMKKFLVLFIIIGSIAAGVIFYDPHLKPYLDPWLAKIIPPGPEAPAADEDAAGQPDAVDKPAPKPKPEGGGKTAVATAPPQTRPAAPVTPAKAELSEIDRILQKKYPLPTILPLMQIVDNWNRVPANAFPTEVALKTRVAFSIPGVGASVAVPGTLVQPARLDNPTLTIVSLANRAMRTTVNVDETDFKERVQQRYNDFVVKTTQNVQAQREKARAILKERSAEEVAQVADGGSGEVGSADDPRFAPVKASLEANELRSVKPEEATAFRWTGKKEIRGANHKGTYDTVTVNFDVETIFGMFPTEWMALLENGKVVGWVDPITHEGSAY